MRGATYTDRQQGEIRRVVPELIAHRELLFDLISKDLRIRYRYAVAGFLWAVLAPLALTLVLYFVFGLVFGARFGRPHYALSLLLGLVFWQFLSRSLNGAARSLVDNENLVSKVRFPREIVPLSALGANLVSLAIGLVIVVALFAVLGGRVGWNALWLAPVFAIQFVLTAGLALLLSCLNVFYRDVAYITEVALIFGFYATPIFYGYEEDVLPLATARPDLAWLVGLYPLNPMVGIITAYRAALLENAAPSLAMLAMLAAAALAALAAGVAVFWRRAGVLADYL